MGIYLSLLMQQSAEQTEQFLQKLLEARIKEATHMHSRYQTFWEECSVLLANGGKRIRPYLTMVGHGGFDEKLLPVAVAQELFHAAMLIHDDIIDQDDMRHHAPTLHKVYRDDYGSVLDKPAARHLSEGVAILAGDALISEAFYWISQSELPAKTRMALATFLHRSMFETVGGELLDVESTFLLSTDFDPLTVARYKTAYYSFTGPLLTGAVCTNVSQAEQAALQEFGENAGIGFQLRDDLLDTFGDTKKTGKPVLADLREGKNTLLLAEYLKTLTPASRQKVQCIVGNPKASVAQLQKVKQAIEDSGARATTEKAAAEYFAQAAQALKQLKNPVRKDELTKLLHYLERREV